MRPACALRGAQCPRAGLAPGGYASPRPPIRGERRAGWRRRGGAWRLCVCADCEACQRTVSEAVRGAAGGGYLCAHPALRGTACAPARRAALPAADIRHIPLACSSPPTLKATLPRCAHRDEGDFTTRRAGVHDRRTPARARRWCAPQCLGAGVSARMHSRGSLRCRRRERACAPQFHCAALGRRAPSLAPP